MGMAATCAAAIPTLRDRGERAQQRMVGNQGGPSWIKFGRGMRAGLQPPLPT
jgi:hypothetical protein